MIPHSPYPQQLPPSVTQTPAGGMSPGMSMGYPQPVHYQPLRRSSTKFVWWVIALLAVGAGVGTALALLFSK